MWAMDFAQGALRYGVFPCTMYTFGKDCYSCKCVVGPLTEQDNSGNDSIAVEWDQFYNAGIVSCDQA